MVIDPQAAFDAMARNRASDRRPAMRTAEPAPHPLDREAFADTILLLGVEAARAALQNARHAVLTAATKADRAAARKAVQHAAKALSDAEAAVAAEARGEEAAPAVQRRDLAQDGVTIRKARVVQEGKRLVLVHPLDRMRARRSLTAAQCAAGHRYRQAWEAAGVSAYPIGMAGMEGGGGGVPGSGNWRIETACGRGADLAQMRAAVGAAGVGLVEHVVVQELDLAGWAARHGVNPQVVTGMFVFALTLLAEWVAGREAA